MTSRQRSTLMALSWLPAVAFLLSATIRVPHSSPWLLRLSVLAAYGAWVVFCFRALPRARKISIELVETE